MTPRRLLRACGLMTAAATLLLGAGLVWFAASARRTAPFPPHAGGIVVLTGGTDRIETALRLLQAGGGDRLLVSGVAHGAGLHDFARRLDFDPVSLASLVTLGHAATSTFGNAGETAAWVQANAIRSLIVVTAHYHMRRAMLELGRAMPDVTLYPWPVTSPVVPGDGLFSLGLTRPLIVEYVKYLAAVCGLSRVVDAREHPVGKFVSG